MQTGKSTIKISFPELRGSLSAMRFPAFVEPKLDGELTKWNGKEFINKYGKLRWDFPACEYLPKNVVLIGELFTNQGKAGELYELLKNKESDDLGFVAFDMLAVDANLLLHLPLVERREMMFEHVPIWQIIAVDVVTNPAEVQEAYKYRLNQGFEGIVVKSLDSPYIEGPCSWVKVKHKDQNDYAVSFVDPTLERIEVDVCGVGTRTQVGCKCPNKYKPGLKVGDIVTIEHQGVLPSGSLRHPVFIKKVR